MSFQGQLRDPNFPVEVVKLVQIWTPWPWEEASRGKGKAGEEEGGEQVARLELRATLSDFSCVAVTDPMDYRRNSHVHSV